MKDFLDSGWFVVVCIFVAIFGAWIGLIIGTVGIAGDCKTFGAFTVNYQKYECKKAGESK